jgi:hypothetical protein
MEPDIAVVLAVRKGSNDEDRDALRERVDLDVSSPGTGQTSTVGPGSVWRPAPIRGVPGVG